MSWFRSVATLLFLIIFGSCSSSPSSSSSSQANTQKFLGKCNGKVCAVRFKLLDGDRKISDGKGGMTFAPFTANGDWGFPAICDGPNLAGFRGHLKIHCTPIVASNHDISVVSGKVTIGQDGKSQNISISPCINEDDAGGKPPPTPVYDISNAALYVKNDSRCEVSFKGTYRWLCCQYSFDLTQWTSNLGDDCVLEITFIGHARPNAKSPSCVPCPACN